MNKRQNENMFSIDYFGLFFFLYSHLYNTDYECIIINMLLVKLNDKMNDKMIMRTKESKVCLNATENHYSVKLSYMLSNICVQFYGLLSYYCCL